MASRTMVQRLLPDRVLTAVFSLQETSMMAGLAVGSLAAPILVAVAGKHGAFLAAGLFLPLIAMASSRRLARMDALAVVPADVLALLRGVPILGVLSARVVERLARDAVRIAAPEGSAVVTEGEHGDRFYVIESGRVAVARGTTELRRLGPGGWFGELALLRHVPRTATVTAVSDTGLLAIDRDAFLTAVLGAPISVSVANGYAKDNYS